MDINIHAPKLVTTAMPSYRRTRSDSRVSYQEMSFFSGHFICGKPKLYITAEDDNFDTAIVEAWKAEGFHVEYFPLTESSDYRAALDALTRQELKPCETFGLVAYGEAAALCLEHFHTFDHNRGFRLGCLIAYYPTRIPDPQVRFPRSITILLHVAGIEVDVYKYAQMASYQGRRHIAKKFVGSGHGLGGSLQFPYAAYTYNAEPGFAEHDLDEYENTSANLAWSRSLNTARNAFNLPMDLEEIVDQMQHAKFVEPNVAETMETYARGSTPHVTHMPTLTGGIGRGELQRFYDEFFVGKNPASLQIQQLSRTSGHDRVVDELHLSFQHTQEMPWMLPGIPATHKKVEIVVISIVTVKGGRISHEHMYWDQASVLVQIGLLKPTRVPEKARLAGVTHLPVVGRSAARRTIEGLCEDEEGEADNKLIESWEKEQETEDTGRRLGRGASVRSKLYSTTPSQSNSLNDSSS